MYIVYYINIRALVHTPVSECTCGYVCKCCLYMVLVIVCVRIINANCTIYFMCVCYEITLEAIKEREINIKLKLNCVSFHFVSFQSKSICNLEEFNTNKYF